MNNCTVEWNRCIDFVQGIHLDDVFECQINSNTILNSEYQGINIRYSDSNIITNNIIINTNQHGIAIVGTSINNKIHHNKLENNAWANSYDIDGGPSQGPPTSQAYDEGSNNIWYDDESQEGNFWSDYFGIGPYSIDGPTGAVDLYPFHTTGLTPFILIITIIPSMIAISAILIVFLRKKRKNI
jgi:parallel beta-helix repeat protein